MDRNLIHGLYRTNDPKFTTYQGDGSGRDTYIIFNDGGLQPQPHFKGQAPKCNFFVSPKANPQKTTYGSLTRQPACVYYPPDGTGRDTYIIKNHGGTCIEPNLGFIDFQSNTFLRDNKYNPFYTPKMNKKFQEMIPQLKEYSNWPSKDAMVRNRQNLKTQVSILDRLSPQRDFEQSTNINFFSPRKNRHKNRKYKEDIEIDPIARQVTQNRMKTRASSVLKAQKYYRTIASPSPTRKPAWEVEKPTAQPLLPEGSNSGGAVRPVNQHKPLRVSPTAVASTFLKSGQGMGQNFFSPTISRKAQKLQEVSGIMLSPKFQRLKVGGENFFTENDVDKIPRNVVKRDKSMANAGSFQKYANDLYSEASPKAELRSKSINRGGLRIRDNLFQKNQTMK